MRINTNIAAMTAMESNAVVNRNLSNSLEKLSSGMRINKASDDASGLAIADKLRTQASSLTQAVSNGNSAVALVQIADKAMAEQSNILDIVKTKLVQAGTATTSAEGREALRKDISKLLDQLDNIAIQTNYNGIQLLQDGSAVDGAAVTSDLNFIMGEKSTNKISVGKDVQSNSKGLALDALRDLAADELTASVATGAMATVDAAINKLNGWRSDFGSTQNQIESAVRNLSTQITNIKAAESVIRDVDMSTESANFNKQNILAQAGTYAMTQANSVQQNILKLLQ